MEENSWLIKQLSLKEHQFKKQDEQHLNNDEILNKIKNE